MGKYIAGRMFLVLPTIIVVMILAFLLSKVVPGDPAVAVLQLQGVNLDNKNYTIEYERQYNFLGLDKPLFYISILPNHYHTNIQAITDANKRYHTEQLLSQKFPFYSIEEYIIARDSFIFWAQKDTVYKYIDVQNIVSKLQFETEILEIQNIISNIINPSDIQGKALYSDLQTAYYDMKSSRIKFYVPSIIWHGLDNQFHKKCKQYVQGDFGISIKDGRLASEKIGSALQWTILLVLLNNFVTFLISLPAGLYAGYRQDGYFDIVSNFFWILLYSMPVFWLASMLIIYFTSNRYGAWMHIFPTPGNWFISPGQTFIQTFSNYASQMILPIVCLAANDIAQLSRIMRNNVISQKARMYVTFARAKGLGESKILFKHILPNVLIPLITVIGARLPAGISGALIVEVIFNIPGMGRLMYESIFSQDWNVVFGILVVISFVTIVFILLTDILYTVVNPKTKLG